MQIEPKGFTNLGGDKDQVDNCSSDEEHMLDYGNQSPKNQQKQKKLVQAQEFVGDMSPSNNLSKNSWNRVINGSMNVFHSLDNSRCQTDPDIQDQEEEEQKQNNQKQNKEIQQINKTKQKLQKSGSFNVPSNNQKKKSTGQSMFNKIPAKGQEEQNNIQESQNILTQSIKKSSNSVSNQNIQIDTKSENVQNQNEELEQDQALNSDNEDSDEDYKFDHNNKNQKQQQQQLDTQSNGSKKQRSLSCNSAIKTHIDEDDSEEEDLFDAELRKKFLFTTQGSFKKLEEPLTHFEHLQKYTEKFNLGSDFEELMQAVEKAVIKISKIIKKSYKYEDIYDIEEAIVDIWTEEVIESGSVALLYNTKSKALIKVPQSQAGRFVMAFNPLDVNKIEDINNNCGLMFVLMKKISSAYKPANKSDFLQSGEKIDCAGCCLFNKYTTLMYHAGFRVNTYFLDPKEEKFHLRYHNIKTPKKKGVVSFNSSVIDEYDKNLKIFLRRKINQTSDLDSFYLRYTGSIITDFFRTILFGGLLLIPQQDAGNSGGINIFEAYAMSYLVEKAWERSSCGADGSVLYKKPTDLDQNVALYLGVGTEVQELENLYLEIRRQNSVFEALKKKNLQNNL